MRKELKKLSSTVGVGLMDTKRLIVLIRVRNGVFYEPRGSVVVNLVNCISYGVRYRVQFRESEEAVLLCGYYLPNPSVTIHVYRP